MTTSWELSDTLHRGVKMALDSGEVGSLEEAEALFASYRAGLVVGPDVAASPTLQALVLTAINTAARSFLGGVDVAGELGAPLLVPWGACTTLGEAAQDMGARVVSEGDAGLPLILVGDTGPAPGRVCVRATFDGWVAAVFPADDDERLPEEEEFVPAGVLAGALAVSEVFQHVRGSNVLAGRRRLGLSLWRPWDSQAWLNPQGVGPRLACLPTDLWLIGLGHLGQAFLWTLGLLPYADPGAVHFLLQDFDALVPANLSTSPLTFTGMIGRKKTRAMAAWCEGRGFRTTIVELPFGEEVRVRGDAPQLALCGVDNPLARSVLEDVGFGRVIEAGLGKGVREYLAFQVHGFPGPQRAHDRWGARDQSFVASRLAARPAYAALADEGLDRCGLTTLAGKTVGAPFVGMAVGAIVVAEIIRQLEGAAPIGLLDGTLRDLANTSGMTSANLTMPFNPGSTEALILPPAQAG